MLLLGRPDRDSSACLLLSAARIKVDLVVQQQHTSFILHVWCPGILLHRYKKILRQSGSLSLSNVAVLVDVVAQCTCYIISCWNHSWGASDVLSEQDQGGRRDDLASRRSWRGHGRGTARSWRGPGRRAAICSRMVGAGQNPSGDLQMGRSKAATPGESTSHGLEICWARSATRIWCARWLGIWWMRLMEGWRMARWAARWSSRDLGRDRRRGGQAVISGEMDGKAGEARSLYNDWLFFLFLI